MWCEFMVFVGTKFHENGVETRNTVYIVLGRAIGVPVPVWLTRTVTL